METTESYIYNDPYISDCSCTNSYGVGWKLMSSAFGILLGVTLVYCFIDLPAEMLEGEDSEWISTIFWIFISGPIGMCTSWVFLKAARRDPIRVSDMFAVFGRNYWNAVAAVILKTIIVVVGFLLFIIPGIIFACRLAFVDYLVIDKEMGIGEALRESWDMTRGHSWTIFGMGLLSIPILFAGLLALVVGVFVAVMWVFAASAVLYLSASRSTPGTAEQ